jgi:hypothetical protein
LVELGVELLLLYDVLHGLFEIAFGLFYVHFGLELLPVELFFQVSVTGLFDFGDEQKHKRRQEHKRYQKQVNDAEQTRV